MLKRTICVLLSACMLMGMVPLSARAEGEAEATTQEAETTAPPAETTPPETTTPEPTVPEDDYTENMTRMSDAAIALLKQYEGFSKYPQWDVSQWSVGYGTRCPGDKLELWKAVGITEREAESLLNGFVNNFGAKLDAFIAKYNLNLNQYQYDALMLFTYNCGAGWMNQTGLLQTAVITGATGNDFIYPFVLWCKADRVFSNGLIERRLAEANLYLNGVYGRRPPSDYSFVRFDANGGTSDYEVQGFDVDEPVPIKVIAATTYTASNGAVYEFEGWYDKRVGGNKVEILDRNRGYATYLYAHWKLVKEGTGPSDGNDPGGVATLVDVTVTGTNLNYRNGPGTNYEALGSYPNGRQLTIVETKSATGYLWGRVANTGTPGYWVALEFTDYYQVIQNQQPTNPPATQPVPPPTTKPTQPPTTKPTEPESTFGTWVGVVKLNDPGSKLYIRSKPEVSSGSPGHLVHGDKVTIVERKTVDNVEWGRMERGWVCLNYVSFDPADVNPPVTQPTQPKPTGPAPTQPKPTEPKPTEPKPTDPAPTDPDPTEPDPTDPSNTDTPETVFPDGEGYWIGVVNTEFLPIRSAAGIVYPIVGYCKGNDSVEITRCMTVDGQLWGRVNGGWICLSFVTLDGENIVIDRGVMMVSTCSLRVRSGPGVENAIVAFLSYGEAVTVYDYQQVSSTLWGLTDLGWVDLRYLK